MRRFADYPNIQEAAIVAFSSIASIDGMTEAVMSTSYITTPIHAMHRHSNNVDLLVNALHSLLHLSWNGCPLEEAIAAVGGMKILIALKTNEDDGVSEGATLLLNILDAREDASDQG